MTENKQRFAIVPRQAAEDAEITDSEFRTLAVLTSYNDDGGWCWPSYKSIAERRGLSRRTVIRHINKLVDNGYLVKNSRKDNDKQTSNKYYTRLDYFEGGSDKAMSPPSDTADVTPPVTPCMSPKDNQLTEPINITKKEEKSVEEIIGDEILERSQNIKDNATPHSREDAIKAAYGIGNADPFRDYPPDTQAYLRAFSKASGINKPIKKKKGDWIDTAREWIEMGLTPNDIPRMVEHAQENFGGIARPGSITSAHNMMKAQPKGDDWWEEEWDKQRGRE